MSAPSRKIPSIININLQTPQSKSKSKSVKPMRFKELKLIAGIVAALVGFIVMIIIGLYIYDWIQSAKTITFTRNIGKPLQCKPDEQQFGLLCYPKCDPGFEMTEALLGVCRTKCPNGFKDNGVACEKPILPPKPLGRPLKLKPCPDGTDDWAGSCMTKGEAPQSKYLGSGFAWQWGDPINNYDNAHKRCETANPQGCDWGVGISYPKCPAGWRKDGCCFCTKDAIIPHISPGYSYLERINGCPDPINKDDKGNWLNWYRPGLRLGWKRDCSNAEDRNKGESLLCYECCPEGEYRVSDYDLGCTKACPENFQDGGSVCTKKTKFTPARGLIDTCPPGYPVNEAGLCYKDCNTDPEYENKEGHDKDYNYTGLASLCTRGELTSEGKYNKSLIGRATNLIIPSKEKLDL